MLNWRQACLWLVGVTLLLSGCVPANFDPTFGIGAGWRAAKVENGIIDATTVCPPLVEYEQEFLDEAADEIETLPTTSSLIRLMTDYATLRALIREC